MIISKASLNTAILTAADKHMPMMNAVCIEPDGSVVASNGKVIAAVSPVTPEMCAAVPFTGKTPADVFGQQIVLSVESAHEIARIIPKDAMFRGVLEHCCLFRTEPEGNTIKVVTTDGKRKNEITVRTIAPKWIQYKTIYQNAFAQLDTTHVDNVRRVVLNRKRVALLIEMIEKVCPYDGDFAPVFWEFVQNGNIVVRAVNELTGQRMLAVIAAVPRGQAEWPKLSAWERKLLQKGAMKL